MPDRSFRATTHGVSLTDQSQLAELEAKVARLEEQLARCQELEQDIHRSHHSLLTILDSLDAIVYVADMQSRELLYINTYAKNLFGDITGTICWQTLQSGQTGPCEFCTNDKLLDSEGKPCGSCVWEFQNTVTGKWFHIRDKAIEWVDGRLVRLEIASDITERKETEQNQLENEQKLRAVFDQAFQFAGVLNVDGEVITINRTALDFAGISEEEVKGKLFWETPWWSHSKRVQEELRAALTTAAGGGTARFVTTHYDPAGKLHYIDTSVKPIIREDGKVIYLVPEGRDITDQIETEQALRASEEQYRGIFEASLDGFAILSLAGKVKEVNQTMCRLFGYAKEELLSLDPLTFIHPDFHEHFPSMLTELNDGNSYHVEGKNIRKDGTIMDMDVHASPLVYQGTPHIFVTMRDITGRKIAEDEKVKLENQLRQAQKMEAIGTLAGGIAHDFNNILTAIMGYTDLAQYMLPKGSPARDHLLAVGKAGFRAKELVKQILAFSRQSESNRMPVQISPIVKEVLKLLRASLPSSIEIKQHICDGLGNIMADPTQIHQVLLNLCANAADAMEESGGVLEITLCNEECSALAQRLDDPLPTEVNEFVCLTVRDTGKGVPPDLQERIFEPFYTTKEKGRGTGMGLSVVHGIVQTHDGKLLMESIPGRGTSFHVFFPVVEGMESTDDFDTAPPPGGSERILVVDDEEAVVKMEQQMLESLGYQVTAMTDSLEAIKLFEKNPENFDLVLTDHTMPVISGSTLMRELLKIQPDIPIILCTGYSALIDEERARQAGAREFVMKPFDVRKLALVVRKVLDNSSKAESVLQER